MQFFIPEPYNFDEIRKTIKNVQKPNSNYCIHFNPIKNRFEYFHTNEISSLDNDVNFEDAEEVLKTYETMFVSANSEEPEIKSNDLPNNKDYDLKPVFDNDDPEILEATSQNLKVLNDIRRKLQDEQREKLAQVISDIYKYDIISESDVALALVENNEYKKLLSMLFSMLNVSVSSTQISSDLKVSSGMLTFNSRIEYRLEDYRRGAAQCLADMRRLAESKDEIARLSGINTDQNHALLSVRKELNELNQKYCDLQHHKISQVNQNVISESFIICWKRKNELRYLKTKTGKKPLEDGTFPTKYLERTSFFNKAQQFTKTQAVDQIAKIIKYRQNITFTHIKDSSTQDLTSYFSILKVTVEK